MTRHRDIISEKMFYSFPSLLVLFSYGEPITFPILDDQVQEKSHLFSTLRKNLSSKKRGEYTKYLTSGTA